ncbi:MAG: hypothetical protein AAF633_29040, partial [Chloroflexota bacterium]
NFKKRLRRVNMDNQQSPLLKGVNFYDQVEIFERYTAHRLTRSETPNDTVEKPAVLELIGELRLNERSTYLLIDDKRQVDKGLI